MSISAHPNYTVNTVTNMLLTWANVRSASAESVCKLFRGLYILMRRKNAGAESSGSESISWLGSISSNNPW